MQEIGRESDPCEIWGSQHKDKYSPELNYYRAYIQIGTRKKAEPSRKEPERYMPAEIERIRSPGEPLDSLPLTPTITEAIEKKFIRLRDKWKAERGPESSPARLALHPAYQAIIGMGPDVVPLLLRELEQRVDFWFWALHAITEEDPTPPESRGNGKEMAKEWLNWGRNKGYTW